MIRAALLCAVLALSGPAVGAPAAQPELPQPQVQAGLAPVLGTGGRQVDFVRGWNVDWNGDGAADLLAQASYANPAGGNAVVTEWYVLQLQGGAITPVAQLSLPGFIEAVYDQPGLVALTLLTYGPDDARCCPSVRVQHWVAKP